MKKSTIDLALEEINTRLNLRLTSNEVEIVNVKYLEEGKYNTSATLRAIPGKGWIDEVEIKYDRINIARLFLGVDIKLKPTNQRWLSGYLPIVNKQFNTLFNSDDIDDVDLSELTPPFTVNMKINDQNPAFYGSVSITVTDDDKSLYQLLKDIELEGIVSWNKDYEITSAELYTMNKNWNELTKLHSGNTIDESFAEAISYLDDNAWYYSEERLPFNLYGAEIIHHGYIEKDTWFIPKLKDNVLMIRVNNDYCTNLVGYLYFYYN